MIRRAVYQPFIKRVGLRAKREVLGLFARFSNFWWPTLLKNGQVSSGKFGSYCKFLDCDFLIQLAALFPSFPTLVRQQADQSQAHCFNLLGSGPTVVAYGVNCLGVDEIRYEMSLPVELDHCGCWLAGRINRANLPEAQRVWGLVDEAYIPIDWQLDFKSGYRWREDTWYRDIRFGRLPGVDIKVPWELTRMQHLPTLTLACHFAHVGLSGFRNAKAYASEFRNQTLDFIANNPPGFGVNWACPMDVAIRAVNLLVAHDIALSADIHFDNAFESVFQASILAHARHIAANLEWSPQYRGNHYLANIAGLLFIAVYLPGSAESDAWLAFSVQELLAETAWQFHEDGSNFEASVCYHRLSAEMLLWCFALLANLAPDKLAALTRPQRHRSLPRLRPQALILYQVPGSSRESPIPDWCWERLVKMAHFTSALTRPDGRVVQFGDNDSGRFITLGSGEQIRADNDPASLLWSLDHGALVAGIRALTGAELGTNVEDDPAAHIVRALGGFTGVSRIAPAILSAPPSASPQIGDDDVWEQVARRFDAAPAASRWISSFTAASAGLTGGLEFFSFQGMGCYVFKSPRMYLAVRCGEIGISGLGAHAHCDQLAIELIVDGDTCVRDPGTAIYTPFPATRNAYRSVRAHHAPRVAGCEPANLALGIFDLRGASEGECLYCGPRGFIGRHAGYGSWVYRIIALEDERIVVRDFGEGGLQLIDPTPEPIAFSPGYGRVVDMSVSL